MWTSYTASAYPTGYPRLRRPPNVSEVSVLCSPKYREQSTPLQNWLNSIDVPALWTFRARPRAIEVTSFTILNLKVSWWRGIIGCAPNAWIPWWPFMQWRQKEMTGVVWAHFMTKSLQIKCCHELLSISRGLRQFNPYHTYIIWPETCEYEDPLSSKASRKWSRFGDS